MNKNPNIKPTTRLSPTLTIVLAIVTLMGIYLLQPYGDDNFYITATFMTIACLSVVGAAVVTAGIKGYGYPRKITLAVIAWRYFLTQYVISVIFSIVPVLINLSFKIELKRYLITHMAIMGLFVIAALLLISGKRQMDEAKMTALNQLCAYIRELRDLVRDKVSGKEDRALIINELDELYTVVSAANPVYSDTLAYIERDIKCEFGVLDECINKLTQNEEDSRDKNIEVLVRISKKIKTKFAEREKLIQEEIEE